MLKLALTVTQTNIFRMGRHQQHHDFHRAYAGTTRVDENHYNFDSKERTEKSAPLKHISTLAAPSFGWVLGCCWVGVPSSMQASLHPSCSTSRPFSVRRRSCNSLALSVFLLPELSVGRCVEKIILFKGSQFDAVGGWMPGAGKMWEVLFC